LKKIKFKTLEMENFRNYKEMSFNFEPNRFCVITGPNGSGKTTLAIDAICWCLYDETSKGRKGDSVIRKRSGKNTRVTIDFSIDDDNYRIENNRQHDEYGNSKVLIKNDVSISGADRSETNKRIIDILMPKDVFKNCLLFSQYIDKPFASMGDTGQKNIFDLMMGFERFNIYYDKTKDYIKNIETEIANLNKELLLLDKNTEKDKELLNSEITIKNNTIDIYKTRKIDLELEISRLISENDRLNKDISTRQEKLDEFKNIQDNISDTTSKINILKEKIEGDKRLTLSRITSESREEKNNVEREFKDRLSAITIEIENINNSFISLKQEITARNESLKSEYYRKENDIKTPIRNELDIIINEFKDAINESHTLRNTIDDLENSKISLQNNILDIEKNLHQEVPICYTCKQEIRGSNLEEVKLVYKDEQDKLSKLIETIEKTKIRKINIDKTVAEKDSCIKEINKREKESLFELDEWKKKVLKELSDFRDTSSSNLKYRENDLNSRKTKIDTELNNSLYLIDKKYKDLLNFELKDIDYKSSENIKYLENSLNILKNKRDILEDNINHMNDISNRINSNNGSIHAKRGELDNLIISNSKYIKDIELKLSRLEKIVDEDLIRETPLRKSIDEFERKLLIAKFWKKAFSPKGIRAILLDESIPVLNEKSRELSSKTDCIRVNFSSQRPLKSGEFRNQFCVLPIQTTNLTDDREDFSQGEGRMVDIITLLSLRHLLEETYDKTFNISLFDEILDSLYKDNAEIVIDFLKKMSESSCTILITHTLRNDIDPDEHLELGR